MSDNWQPMETAPYHKIIRVRNKQFAEGEWMLATRGYATESGVHPNNTYCTSVANASAPFPSGAGNLVCPTEWQPHEESTHD